MKKYIYRKAKQNGGENNTNNNTNSIQTDNTYHVRNENNQKGGVSAEKRRTTIKKKFKKPTNEDMFLDYVATGRRDLVEEYLDNNYKHVVKIRNCKGETALHVAAANKQNDILDILLPYFTEDDLDIRDMYGLPPHITAIKYGNTYGAHLISQYHSMIKTKSYRFKNYSFADNVNIWNNKIHSLDNLIINGDKVSSVINQKSLNKMINKISKLDKHVPSSEVIAPLKKSKKKTVKKEIKLNNENINTKIRRIFTEMFKQNSKTKKKTGKRKSEQNLLNEINRINRIENLPEGLRYLPKGYIKQKNQVLNHNNTKSKAVIIRNKKENKTVTKKKGKTQETQTNRVF
jgi:hypothetical protein